MRNADPSLTKAPKITPRSPRSALAWILIHPTCAGWKGPCLSPKELGTSKEMAPKTAQIPLFWNTGKPAVRSLCAILNDPQFPHNPPQKPSFTSLLFQKLLKSIKFCSDNQRTINGKTTACNAIFKNERRDLEQAQERCLKALCALSPSASSHMNYYTLIPKMG